MASFINAAHYDSSSSSSGVCNKPTNTADNDIMFAFICVASGTAPNSVPSGWSLVGNTGDYFLYRKLASSEGASYTW